MCETNLHKALALQLVHLVGSAVQPLPLRVKHRVCHLPPGAAVQQQCQPNHTCHGNQHRVHGLILPVHFEDCQQGHAHDQAAQDEEEDDKGWDATCLLPLLFTWGKSGSQH